MAFDIEAARHALGDLRFEAATLRQRIESLAVPRLSGSEGADEVRAQVREAFEALGYETTELPFSFSAWPGRFGPPAAGVSLVVTGVVVPLAVRAGSPGLALGVAALGLALALLPLVVLDPAMRRLPWGRIETSNLLFKRPGASLSWLIMAHRDSKSQWVPTLVRTGAVVLGTAAWLALLVLAALGFAGEPFLFTEAAVAAGGVVTIAGVTLLLSWAGNRSPGAVDNASGLAALLAVAEESPAEVGFVVTDGEELGLAGSRHLAGTLPAVQGVINVDGLDDRGEIRVAEGHGLRRRGSAPQLAAALLTTGRAFEITVRRRPLPRSILVDHQPLAASGVPALTVVRGGWRTLLRVHRPADGAGRLNGRGAAEAATVLAGAVRLLAADEDHLAAEGGDGP